MSASPALSLDLAQVERALLGTRLAGQLYHLASTPSTNTLALEAAARGITSGVWVADEQTAGRGRGGHTWHSAPADGLYVSVLLRPRIVGIDALKLSLAAGLAARSAVLAATGIRIDLRWPNDLMLPAPGGLDSIDGRGEPDRKVGGILTESAMDGGDGALSYAVIGIGMNLNHRELPPHLRPIATSLCIALGRPVSRERILALLLRDLDREVDLVEAEAADLPSAIPALNDRFAAASTWVHNLRVHVAEGAGYTGVTDGLDRYGLLQVRLPDGTRRTVRHGGVRRA